MARLLAHQLDLKESLVLEGLDQRGTTRTITMQQKIPL